MNFPLKQSSRAAPIYASHAEPCVSHEDIAETLFRRLFVTCGVFTRYLFVAFSWLFRGFFVDVFRLEKQCLGLFCGFFVAPGKIYAYSPWNSLLIFASLSSASIFRSHTCQTLGVSIPQPSGRLRFIITRKSFVQFHALRNTCNLQSDRDQTLTLSCQVRGLSMPAKHIGHDNASGQKHLKAIPHAMLSATKASFVACATWSIMAQAT